MSRTDLVKNFEKANKKSHPLVKIGDTVCVTMRIVEGQKERLQAFTGLVIAKKGEGVAETMTIYRNAYGCSMERVFMIHSPRVAKIEVKRFGNVRRSKLYYIRGTSGKASKVKEKIGEENLVEETTVSNVQETQS